MTITEIYNRLKSDQADQAAYRSAYKMSAPHWVYYDGEIYAVNAKLENRPQGATIPAVFEIMGQVVPEGYRCFKIKRDTIIIRRK